MEVETLDEMIDEDLVEYIDEYEDSDGGDHETIVYHEMEDDEEV
jgi:hypothetical protein